MATKSKESGSTTHYWKSALKITAVTFLFFFVYAIIRYVALRGIAIDQIPLFINNKAIALAAVYLIGFSYVLGPLARLWPKSFGPKLYLRKYLGILGFSVAAIHAFISAMLLSPAYYPRFFTEAGKLTLNGELSMLFGTLALFIFAAVSITSLPSVEEKMHRPQWQLIQRIGYLAFFLVALHVFVFAWRGWINPEAWSNWMAPMSFLAVAFITFVLIMRFLVIFLGPHKAKNQK
jgi:DMSO/TMAO reductase YedYZ heme-binding membrane subunit